MESAASSSVFARRLREARLRRDLPQDRLGVMIGIDEGASSARMSRYESGTHQPPFALIPRIAQALGVPQAYFFCEDDALAEVVLLFSRLPNASQQALLGQLRNAGGASDT